MVERYTTRAKQVIFYARFEAEKLSAATLEPCHLLLGLEQQDKRATKRFLETHPEMERLRQQRSPSGVPVSRFSAVAELPLTKESDRALSAAAAMADAAHREGVEPEDLLAGLLLVAKEAAA